MAFEYGESNRAGVPNERFLENYLIWHIFYERNLFAAKSCEIIFLYVETIFCVCEPGNHENPDIHGSDLGYSYIRTWT